MSDNWFGWSPLAGKTSQSMPFRLVKAADGTDLTGKVASDLTAYYWRQGGTATAISLSDLAAVDSAYSSGGVKEIDATNMPGAYRLDIPDAAIAAGVEWVVISVKCATAVTYQVLMVLSTVGTADIEAQTDDIGAAGAGLTALGDARLANLDAAVSTLATAAKLLSYVKALARKDLAADADIGGTFDPATDSQEALAETLDTAAVFPAGSVEYTYTVTNTTTGLPLDGVEVWIATDVAGAHVIWSGHTDAFGVARDADNEKPWLDAGTYYFFRRLSGYTFSNPDTEVVS